MPAATAPRDRRVTVSDLKRQKKALTKALRRERKRQDMIAQLRKENDQLSFEVSRVRDARNNTGECC
jgi:septal ring factor EnvC (AmiA/AmiB activator)